MKQTLLLPAAFLLALSASAQSNAPGVATTAVLPTSVVATDSTKQSFKFKEMPWYVRGMPFSIYTGAGKTNDRVAQYIEIGKSFNVIDLGVAVGRNALRPDTTFFAEGKVTMDVCNFGIFANEMTIGAGKLFNGGKGSLMLELSYNIFAQVSKHWGFGITTGYFDFSNEFTDTSKTFFGFYLRYGLQRTDAGGLVGLARRPARPMRPGRRGHGR